MYSLVWYTQRLILSIDNGCGECHLFRVNCPSVIYGIRAKEVLQQVKKQSIILTQRGRARAVLVDFDAYNQLVERQVVLEGTLDAFLLQRAGETAQEYLPLDALLRNETRQL